MTRMMRYNNKCYFYHSEHFNFIFCL